ncbi:rod shape-determining protein MreD [Candidatus Parcubacteria bacterium]|nr:MAG: rod shape-determining protein MreD [Candidatus Parcubacteria bacterium]
MIMKYIVIILMYLIGIYSFLMLSFLNNGWQYVQPFLVIVLLVYFNINNDWLYYTFALICGLTIDAFSGVFGLHAIIYLAIIFILKNLQLSILTSKNILTILLLTILSFIIFWLLFWATNFIASWDLYSFSQQSWKYIFRALGVDTLLIILLHLLYFNFFLRKHVTQSF